MASRNDGPPLQVQFADSINPARQKTAAAAAAAAAVPFDGSFEKELSYDLDQEERARKIAEQDFGLRKKQVRLS